MKKYSGIMVIMFMLAALPLAASADVPAPEGPFNTAFRIQNLDLSEAAQCEFSFYDADGVEQYASGVLPDIPVGDSAYIYVPVDTTVDDGQYAAVVTCDREVAAVVNFSDADSGASYSGVGEPGAVVYAPGIYDNYYSFYSNVVAQNASGAAMDITVEIYEPGNPTPVYTETAEDVANNGFATFEQEGLAELANNQFYSAKIMGVGGDVAAIVNIYGKDSTDDQLYSYNPFASGSTVAYAPVIMNAYYGYNTALVIQNLGDDPAQVTITYGDGTVKTTEIDPGAADSRYTPNEGLATGLLTAAKVESTNGEPIVVLVNESTDKNRAASYTGFASGSETVRAPIVMRRYFKYNTSITCQNIGDDPATMSIEYGGISGSTTSPMIDPNDIHLFYQPTDPLVPDDWIGSATITSAENIVCVVNEDMNEPPERDQIMDQLYAYNGIGQ